MPSPQYPRVYRATLGWHAYRMGPALLLGILCLIALGNLVAESAGSTYALVGFFLLTIAACSYIILGALRSKIVLHADCIELHKLASMRSFRRDEIAGWRLQTNRSPALLVIAPKAASAKPAKVAVVFQIDEALDQWLQGLDCLDDLDLADAYEKIARDGRLGSDEEERLETLARAHRLARRLNGAGLALVMWTLLYPKPREIVMALLFLCPWIAAFAAWRSSGLIRFDTGRNDARPRLWMLVIVGCGLTALAVRDTAVVSWIGAVLPALAIATLLSAVLHAADPVLRANKTSALAMLALSCVYGLGASLEINTWADSSDMTHHRYAVLEKRISSGKVTRHIAKLRKVQALSPDVEEAELSPHFYETLQPGAPVCLAVRPGALGIQWFSAGPCPPSLPR